MYICIFNFIPVIQMLWVARFLILFFSHSFYFYWGRGASFTRSKKNNLEKNEIKTPKNTGSIDSGFLGPRISSSYITCEVPDVSIQNINNFESILPMAFEQLSLNWKRKPKISKNDFKWIDISAAITIEYTNSYIKYVLSSGISFSRCSVHSVVIRMLFIGLIPSACFSNW